MMGGGGHGWYISDQSVRIMGGVIGVGSRTLTRRAQRFLDHHLCFYGVFLRVVRYL